MRQQVGKTEDRVRPVAIFDLDGTLAQYSHRRGYLVSDNPDWKSFFEAAHFDPLAESVAALFHMVRMSVPIIVCTGRPEKYRDLTERWLARKGLFVDQVYMRSLEDDGYKSDATVKRELLQKIREDGWEPMFVFEDRDDVTEMWREEGITCFQLKPPSKLNIKKPWKLADLE